MSGLFWVGVGIAIVWVIGTHMIVSDLVKVTRVLESRIAELERGR